MLASTYEYRESLVQFCNGDDSVPGFLLLSSYWDECVDLMQLLKVFEQATKDLSGCYYPTSTKVLSHCCFIAAELNKCSHNPRLQMAIIEMVKNWLKYFSNINDLFLYASCLSLDLNYDGVCQLLEYYYNFLRTMSFAGTNGINLELSST